MLVAYQRSDLCDCFVWYEKLSGLTCKDYSADEVVSEFEATSWYPAARAFPIWLRKAAVDSQ